MDLRRQKFLAYVLGTAGAGLLIKTIEKTPVLEHAIVPRTILAWLSSASGFEGEILDGIQIVFEKSETGFTGSIGMGAESYEFENESVFHVGASVAVALGIENLESDGLRTLDIERLGKTIDLMSKAHRVSVELEKVSPPGKFNKLPEKLKEEGMPASEAFGIAWKQHDRAEKSEDDPEDDKLSDEEFERKYDVERLKARKAKKEAMAKALGDSSPPAAPAASQPGKPAVPKVATASTPKSTMPKATSTSTMSLTRSEASAPCGDCGGKQIVDDKFVGCLCFEAIAKSVKVTSASAAGLVLELDRRVLEKDDVDALIGAFGGDSRGK